jgi:predicted acylesterase/phospholipase RssA
MENQSDTQGSKRPKLFPAVQRQDSPNVKRARDILSGAHANPDELYRLAEDLYRKENQFGYARKLMAKLRIEGDEVDDNKKLKLAQKHALLTYKDPDLPNDVKFTRALEILRKDAKLATTYNQETLGLAGAIYKRRWESEGQKTHLNRSFAYYNKGYEQGVAKDLGYTAINAAYVLDLIAAQEDEETKELAGTVGLAGDLRAKAAKIRQEIIDTLLKLAEEKSDLLKDWWFLVTLAEAYFGRRAYPEASRQLKQAAELPDTSKWQFDSTALQLTQIAHLQARSDLAPDKVQQAKDVVNRFISGKEGGKEVKHPEALVQSFFAGKVGLALSGGGFRASLFHIGALARLADIGALNRVEVISCVSGGSIVGAHYYLELRRLFAEGKKDADFKRKDYIQIVKNLEKDFLAGIQTNIRTSVMGDLWANLKMFFGSGYSRTQRVGDLYEQNIYARVDDDGQRNLNELTIRPEGEPDNFSPKTDNWRRANKVPILIINATSLNTGHNWQFTARYMGEPPASINTEIDASYRLRRMYYDQAPGEHQNVKLGFAVAASSCVPGMFEPLPMENLYPDGRVVRLVDGGVFDNQGAASLLEQDCNVLLVSDASGQMATEDNPADGALDVLMRASLISQERIRWSEYAELDARRRAALLRGLMFIHLRKELSEKPLDWIGCLRENDYDFPPPNLDSLTRYNVNKVAQRLLSAVRTDLDSFSDGEAYALMASGYLMAEYEFPKTLAAFPGITQADLNRPPSDWEFLNFVEALKKPNDYQDFFELLKVANQSAFKIWRLSAPLRKLRSFVAGAASALLILLVWWYFNSPASFTKILSYQLLEISFGPGLWSLNIEIWFIFSLIVGGLLLKGAAPAARFLIYLRSELIKYTIKLAASVAAWVTARLHLRWFDRWYLDFGSKDRMLGKNNKSSSRSPGNDS